MEQTSYFKITNTTIKPPRIVKGVDQRSIRERRGHFLEIPESPGKDAPRKLLHPGHFMTTTYIDNWLAQQEAAGECKIEPVQDMGALLDQFRNQAQPKTLDKAISEPVKPQGARAVESGSPGQDEGAINPDGKPNFVVTAKHQGNLQGD